MSRPAWLTTLILSAALGVAVPATAQPSGALAAVEQAYAEVDYDKTRTLARAALEQGRSDRATTARLYLLWGTAAAALDQASEARTAFLHVLAADPELRLDKSLSPKLRGPYLEARGELTLAQGHPPLDVTLQRRERQLELGLRDLLRVAKRVDLATRARADEAFTVQRFEPQAVRRLVVPRGQELEFFIHALDRYGNVLAELGSLEAPQRLALVSGSPAPFVTVKGAGADRTPYFVTAVTLATLGVASGAVAAVMHTRREDAAREWNGAECERPGSTRAQQCASVDERRQRSEYLTIGLSAAGGALLIGSVVSLLLAPSGAPAQAGLELEAAPRSAALKWRRAF